MNADHRRPGANVTIAAMAALTLLVGSATAEDAPGPSVDLAQFRPNILYIFADDLSHRAVSCYPEAHDWVQTPSIERLANEGVQFTTCYTGAHCLPSRVTALTGRLQHGKGLRNRGGAVEWWGADENPDRSDGRQPHPFWPAAFRKAGYHTGVIGKWHDVRDEGHGRSWDYTAIWDHTTSVRYYTGQSIRFNGPPGKKVGGYSTDNYTDWAVEYVKARAGQPDRPWYLWLCYDGVHHPFMPAARNQDDYKQTPLVPVPRDIYPPRPDKPRYMRDYGVWRCQEDGQPRCIRRTPAHFRRTLTELVRQYNRAVRAVDEGVGRVLAALEETGQLENTVVIFTSDQGYAWGQHGFAWKYAPYDANLRAPLLVRYPKRFPQGAVCTKPVGGHDLIPTFFALADIQPPWKMHGRSILPLLTDPKVGWNEPVMLENLASQFGADTDAGRGPGEHGVPWWIFLRKGKYKYIRTLVADEIEELYDLESDPGELHNLAVKEEHHDQLAKFREMLIAELKRTDAGMVDNLPPVKVVTNKEK